MKKPTLHAAALIAAALVIALVANAFAGRTRKLVLPGYYPGALKVPAKVTLVPSTAGPASAGPAIEQGGLKPAPTSAIPTTTLVPDPVERSGRLQPAEVIPKPDDKGGLKPASTSPPESTLTRFPPHPDKAYVEIGGEDVGWLHARGALFLDARRSSVFEQGHIAGARTFSVWESDIDDKVNKLFEERGDPEAQLQPIVIYCSGGACEDSHMLAQKLWGLQFNNVLVYKDGFPDWQQRGGAVKTGVAP